MSKPKDPIERAVRSIVATLAPLTDDQRSAVLTAVRVTMTGPGPVKKERAKKAPAPPAADPAQ